MHAVLALQQLCMQTLQFVQFCIFNSVSIGIRSTALYEPNYKNVVPAFLCGSAQDRVVEEDFNRICFLLSYICSVNLASSPGPIFIDEEEFTLKMRWCTERCRNKNYKSIRLPLMASACALGTLAVSSRPSFSLL